MAAMVAAAAMADEPAVDLNIAEFKGDATVTWGIDLDSDGSSGVGRTGFRNDASASLKLNIINAGDKSTEGDGVWGEVKVKLDNAFVAKAGDGETMDLADGKVVLDVAKLHIGDLYIGLKAGDTKVGGLNLPNALYSDKFGVTAKGEDKTQGLVVGYGNDLFGVDVDFRSEKNGTDYYTDDYAVAAEAQLKDLSGFSAKAGASFAFKSGQLGLFGQVGYKLPLGDNWLKVTAGAGFDKAKGASLSGGEVAASVLYGWGDEGDGSAVYYVGDAAKKKTPGVGVAVFVPLVDHTYIDIVPAFYSGEIIENLTASVLGEVILPVNNDGLKMGMAVAAGASYKLAVGDAITVTPQAGFRFANADYAGGKASTALLAENTDNSGLSDLTKGAATDSLLNLKAGVDIAGVIPNTTFSAWYQSRNLTKTGNAKAGTFNISAKVSF